MLNGMMLFYDALDEYRELTAEQFGNLIRAGLVYARDGTETELALPERYFFPGLKLKIDRDKSKYQEKCAKNAENIRKRWNQQRGENDSTEYERIETNTNHTNTNPNPKSNPNTNTNPNPNTNPNSKGGLYDQTREGIIASLIRDGYTRAETEGVLARLKDGEKIRDMKSYLKAAIDRERREKIIGKHNPARDYEQRDYSGGWETTNEMMERLEMRESFVSEGYTEAEFEEAYQVWAKHPSRNELNKPVFIRATIEKQRGSK